MGNARHQLMNKCAVGLVAASSSIVVLTAQEVIPDGGILSAHLACVGASIPTLVWFYICQHEYPEEVRTKKIELWLTVLFAVGAAMAFAGYVILMAAAGTALVFGFLGGIGLGGLAFWRMANAIDAQQNAPADAETAGRFPRG